MKYVPFKNFLQRTIKLKNGEAYYADEVFKALEKYEKQFVKKPIMSSEEEISEAISTLRKLKEERIQSSTVPTEQEIMKTIFDCVDIRGIDLVLYERNFSNKESGLYDALIKLFNKH